MATITRFQSERDLVVYDINSKDTGWRVPVQNPAIDHFYPHEPVAVLWLNYEGHKATLDDLARSYTISETNLTTQQTSTHTYYGNYAWGSSVKKGKVILLTRDIPRESGLAQKGEDGFRFNRWLLPNAMYGAGTGAFRVRIVQEHEVINGLPVEDGFGYISKSFAKAIYNGRNKSEPGRTRDAFHFWQMIPWDKALEQESLPHIKRVFDEYRDMSKWDIDASTGIDLKKKLVGIEPQMEYHPSVANALLRSSQRRAVRMATSVPTETYSRIAVPTRFSQPVLEGRKIIVTYPIQAYGNIRAFDLNSAELTPEDRVLHADEKARIAAIEVCQYSMSDRTFVAKGLSGIVDDDTLVIDGVQYDVIICAEDIKMVAGMSVSQARQLSELVVSDGYYGMTMLYAAGVAVGMPQPIWKKMGRDYDGDYAYVMQADDRPVLFSKVQAFPEQPTLKLIKSDSDFQHGDIRPKMILDSIEEGILVGAATNMRCTFFSVRDLEFLAHDRGWHNATEFLIVADELIRIGTDGFKSKVDIQGSLEKCRRIQSSLVARLPMQAPWCKWQDDPYLFKHKLPEFAHTGMTRDEVKQSIPIHMDGTVTQILKITLPALKTILETPIEAMPLTSYLAWAHSVAAALMDSAKALQAAYDQRSQRVNWSDPAEILDFHAWWQKRCEEYCAENGCTRADGAAALWRVAHSKASEKSGGMSVFIGFEDEVISIIRNKPGLAEQGMMYVLTGVNYALDDSRSNDFTCEVQVKLNEFVDVRDGRKTLRKVAVANLPGQKPANPGYPQGCLGTFSTGSKLPEPELGTYTAHVKRHGTARMWFVDLDKEGTSK